MIWLEDIEQTKQGDPVFKTKDGKWYFWDETGSDEYGPYETEKQAREELDKYVKEVLG